jgi:ribonuclease P protein component
MIERRTGQGDSMVKKHSYSKTDRLLKPKEFSRTIKSGKRFTTVNYTVYVLKNSLSRHRLGLAVSARVANGPGRVRLKRLLREFFRLNRDKLSSASILPFDKDNNTPEKEKTVDIVISAKKSAGTDRGPKKLLDVEKELLGLFKRG